MFYFGTRLSENISRREPEGYLICLNVPVARTGTQEYLPEELGQPPGGPPVPVYRPEEEVFSPATQASFEGMPVTDDHPVFPEGVTADNIRYLQKGHAHNIRRGSGDESDLLLADLIITDPSLIDEILSGKREISCGYNYTLCEESGRFVQRSIRGNHIAVVDAGRAGPRVSIKDHYPDAQASVREFPLETLEQRRCLVFSCAVRGTDDCPVSRCARASLCDRKGSGSLEPLRCERRREPSREGEFPEQRAANLEMKHYERSTPNMSQPKATTRDASRRTRSQMYAKRTARLMAHMAKDGETEELAEMIAELMEPGVIESADPAGEAAEIAETVEEILEEAPAAEEPAAVVVPENREITIDCGEQIVSLLQQIISLLQPAADCGSSKPAEDEDPADDPAEAVAEAVLEAMADPGLSADPVEAIVEEVVGEALQEDPAEAAAGIAEAIETAVADPGIIDGDPDSGLIEPEEANDTATRDLLRRTLPAFRPAIRNLSSEDRRRMIRRIVSGIRAEDRNRVASGSPAEGYSTGPIANATRDAYGLLRNPSRYGSAGSDKSLGERIMAKRNANLRKNA